MDRQYDVIIVGSGLGGLTTASLLARLYGKKVLLLERHSKAGGLTHTFKRPGGYEFDTGIHYVGGMAEGTTERTLFDFVSDGQVGWQRMAEPFEKLVYPDFTFDVHGKPARHLRELIKRFPKEEKSLRRYQRDIVFATRWLTADAMAKSLSPLACKAVRLMARPWRRRALMTTEQYLETHFKSPELRALLNSQWGDYGLPASRSAFGSHAVIALHYRHGGYYPEGGSATIAKAIGKVIEDHGGRIAICQEVTQILLDGDKAVGVMARDRKGKSKRYLADVVVSGAGAYNTYAKLLPASIGKVYADQLRPLSDEAPSMVTVYLGLKHDPEKLGFFGENHWISTSYDHEKHAAAEGLFEGKPSWCYLSFPSKKGGAADKGHTAEILAIVDQRAFSRWQGSAKKKRGEAYVALKKTMADGLLELVNAHYPGFSENVERVEVSTPLTMHHYVAGPGYGLAATPARFELDWLGPRTPVKGLYLTGADACLWGVVGALMSGVSTAGAIAGPLGALGIVAQIKRRAMRAE